MKFRYFNCIDSDFKYSTDNFFRYGAGGMPYKAISNFFRAANNHSMVKEGCPPVQRFIGATDANKTPIYEGDVCTGKWGKMFPKKCIVKYEGEKGAFGLSGYRVIPNWKECYVIGNVFQFSRAEIRRMLKGDG